MTGNTSAEIDAWVSERLTFFRRADGSIFEHNSSDERWLRVTDYRTSDGGVASIRADITQLKLAQEEIARKEAQLRIALDNMPGGMFMVDEDLVIRVYNQQYKEMYDLPDTAVREGISLAEAVRVRAERGDYGPGDPEELIEQRMQGYFGGKTMRHEERLPNGRVIELLRTPAEGGGFVGIATEISERKRAAAALVESREHLQALADNLPDFICLKDTEGRFLFINKRYEELVGVTQDDVIGKTLFDIYPDEEAAEFDARDREAMDSGKGVLRLEGEHTYADGISRTVVTTRFPVISSKGELFGLGNITHDITERKQAERELAQAYDEMQAVLENVDYGIVFMDSELRARVINRAFVDLWNMDRDITQERPTMADLMRINRHTGLYPVSDDEFDAFVESRVADVRAGAIAPTEMRRADGKVLRYQCIALPDGGRMITYFDITELREAEDEARESESRARAAEVQVREIIENMTEGLVCYDTDQRLVLCNSAYRGIYGYSEEDTAPGTRFEDLVRLDIERSVIANDYSYEKAWFEFREQPEGTRVIELADGRWYQVRERTTANGVVSIQSDITQRKRAEQQIADAHGLITSSIEYASRIQRAALPSDEQLSEALGEHFVIWQPRDVVGGDIYWVRRIEGGHVVAVADCTGHGVPGAFLTMIATGALRQAIIEHPDGDPAAGSVA